jgi:hypothetical protein
MPRYLISMTGDNARMLESWLGGRIKIVPATGRLPLEGGEPDGGATIAGLDAVFDSELALVKERLRSSGPSYHFGGPGTPKCSPRTVYVTAYARKVMRRKQPLHIAILDTRNPGNIRALRLDKSLCGVWVGPTPESGAAGRISSATCQACIRRYAKITGSI